MTSQIIEIEQFEAAFPVPLNKRDEAKRRFSTLLLDTIRPRQYGSNGVVSKAHNVFNETFAVKRLRVGIEETPLPDIPPAQASSGAVAAFRNEYESQLALSNMRGFPKLFGYGLSGSSPLIVMEWIDGVSLADALVTLRQNGKLDPATVMALGAELFNILRNLDVLTTRPVHRDLSLSNVMICTNDRSIPDQFASKEFDLRIIDFGSTTLINEQDPSFTATTSILRHATPEYAPPEMLSDTLPNILELRQSPSIDIYAACSILYQLLQGSTPFRISERPGEVPYLIKTQEQPAPLQIAGCEEACNAIMRGLDPDQAKRPSAEEMYEVLSRAHGCSPVALAQIEASEPDILAPSDVLQIGQPETGSSVREASFEHAPDPETQAPAARRPLVSRRGFLALAGCAAIALIGGGTFAALAGNQQPEPEEETSEESLDVATYAGGSLYSAQDPNSGLWGYLNAQRQWVIAPMFTSVPGLFVDGLACVQDPETGLYGYINEQGQWALEPRYGAANMFGEGLAFVQAPENDPEGNLGGWIDKEGNWAIKPNYYGGGVFKNGLATFKSTDNNSSRWGYLDQTGKVIIEEQYFNAGSFSDNGLALASLHVANYGWIDKTGAWKIEPQYGKALSFSDGLAAFMDPFSELWGYIDASGKEVIAPVFASARLFKSSVAACKDEDTQLWGFIDKTGAWVIDPKFARAGDFAHGLAPAQDASTNKFGYIDDTGYWVIPPQYSDVNLNVME